jgi:GNAT superfamily N-acetyltransferase
LDRNEKFLCTEQQKSPMEIRKAKLSDVNGICVLWEQFMREHDRIILRKSPFKKELRQRKAAAKTDFRKHVQKNIRSPLGSVLVAADGKKLVGYSLIYIRKHIPIYAIEKVGYISDLYVKAEYRNRKLSSQFKEKALDWFKSKKLKFAAIAYHAENTRAESIYSHWGFFVDHSERWKKLV